jgi:uroporphyrinogen III methyltransferase/synthase
VSGFVYLVGAGPGDPRLLTLRALELLQSAEVVAHDELVSREILALAPSSAELIPVGRRAGHGSSAYRLHPVVMKYALSGRNVLRLKGGDPLIFGRGGEEAEELAEAGIPFEIVPGVSAALGAGAYCGIPLTHRLYASGVTFSTGSDASRRDRKPKDTAVVFMAGRRLAENVARLLAQGRSKSTPAAYVTWATTRLQRVVVGTLADLPGKVREIDPAAPALLVVGDVVGLRSRLSWFEGRPLVGRRILLARTEPGRSGIAAQLRALGAEVVEAPQVEVAELEDTSSLEAVLAQLDDFRGVVFASAAGVEAVLHRRSLAGVQVAAFGERATGALARRGLHPVVFRSRSLREESLGEWSAFREGRVLLVTVEGGHASVEAELASIGVKAETLAAYRHIHRLPALATAPLDAVVLPNAAAAKLVLTSELALPLQVVPTVAMGPRTAECASLHGVQRVTCARDESVPTLLEAVLSLLARSEEEVAQSERSAPVQPGGN